MQNRLWFAEYGSNGVGMFDPKTEKITEWKKPLEWESPYDVVADRNGEVWEVNEASDRLGRLDPKTGEWVNYPLPRYSQLPPRVRRRPDLAGEGVGRQQSRRDGDEARTVGLTRPSGRYLRRGFLPRAFAERGPIGSGWNGPSRLSR